VVRLGWVRAIVVKTITMERMEKASGVSAVVLAAGMSRRMGTPKQLLRIEGKTVLQRTLENVRASVADEIVLVLGFAAQAVEQAIATDGLKVVRNADYEQGMGTSLRTGLAAVNPAASAAIIVLADQPFVQAATLNQLVECHRARGAQIAIPVFRGFRGNPVLLDRSVFAELRELSGDVGCRAIFGNHTENIRKLPVEDPGILIDIDSREDLDSMAQSGGAMLNMGIAPLESRPGAAPGQPELVLVGRDNVTFALAKLGRLMKFTVIVVDPFRRLSDLPDADAALHALNFSLLPAVDERYVVAASRGQFDEEAVEQALQSNARYVALLANRKRAQELAKSLRVQGVAAEKVAGIRAPAGLEIGAQSPEEIALSIMAEIIAERRLRSGQT
jgi:molybdenum cofactor cytidylyltransferase